MTDTLHTRIAAVLGACRMSDFDDRDGVELPPKSAQSDDLRTRIAAVVDAYFDTMRRDQGYIVDGVTGDEVADAVIRELECDYRLVPKKRTLNAAFKYGEHYGI